MNGLLPLGCIILAAALLTNGCYSSSDEWLDIWMDGGGDDTSTVAPWRRCVPNLDSSNIRTCNEHPGFDGKGTCRAGTQTCLPVMGGGGEWSECEGDVGPSFEACGPESPDTNCNGIQGDGDGCLVETHIFLGGDKTWHSCMSERYTMRNALPGMGFYAAPFPVNSEDEKMNTFFVFKKPLAGTAPLWNCRTKYDEWDDQWISYIKIGDTCAALSIELSWEMVSLVGYVSIQEASGYERLSQLKMANGYYGNTFRDISFIPVAQCPKDCTCSMSNTYAIR